MRRVLFPTGQHSRRLTFYLAAEEYLAKKIKGETGVGEEIQKEERVGKGEIEVEEGQAGKGEEGCSDLFFMWQTGPTVIFGHNQDIESEVNLEYCKAHGVDIVRRKSGGGCVYSDQGNLMLSVVSRSTDVKEVFARSLGLLADAVARLGIPVVTTEHNDVLASGRKVSGSAFHLLPHSGIFHATLLCHTDFGQMAACITPSVDKMAKHGVQSVRQRVANLTEFDPALEVPAVRPRVEAFLAGTDAALTLSKEDLSAIESIEKEYTDTNYTYGRNA